MKEKINLTAPGYTPARLINAVGVALDAKSDNHLGYLLGFDNGALSRIRNRKSALPDSLLVIIMDATGWPIDKLRELAGMKAPTPRLPLKSNLVGFSENRRAA
jgi:hypothetical protein